MAGTRRKKANRKENNPEPPIDTAVVVEPQVATQVEPQVAPQVNPQVMDQVRPRTYENFSATTLNSHASTGPEPASNDSTVEIRSVNATLAPVVANSSDGQESSGENNAACGRSLVTPTSRPATRSSTRTRTPSRLPLPQTKKDTEQGTAAENQEVIAHYADDPQEVAFFNQPIAQSTPLVSAFRRAGSQSCEQTNVHFDVSSLGEYINVEQISISMDDDLTISLSVAAPPTRTTQATSCKNMGGAVDKLNKAKA
ncbi:hypothetical protein VNI00_016009 [Paramarasmius palmivorus]|uniref:Uncharacterized protein n=1 Tax=Paramarasmius palmivorus TaxID=297713 RepID=A0AAW0BIQ5_9AGAR